MGRVPQPDIPFPQGKNNKLRRVSPYFSERDGMELQPFEFRQRARAPSKFSSLHTRVSETNGQGQLAATR
jgi:hypothetical protein